MNRLFEIRYLQTAVDDLEEIFDYIIKDSPSAAASILDRFDLSIAKLSTNPKIGLIPKDERLKKLGYRMLIVDKYLIFYVIKGNCIQVRRVIHGVRQYEFLI
jgi:toxin ParE1/3/4